MTVAANFFTMALGQPPQWVVYLLLPLLFLMTFSRLCLFALPHVAGRQSGEPLFQAADLQ